MQLPQNPAIKKKRHSAPRAACAPIVQPVANSSASLEGFVSEYDISPRKKELLVLLLDGATTKRMAATMGIAEYTVRIHIHEILRNVGLPKRKCLVTFIRRSRDSTI